MTNRVLPIPLFGLRKNTITTNELVFQILRESHPKTVAALKEELARRFHHKLSYQAVRKAVFALTALGAVTHQKNGYQLSLDWLLKTRAVIDDTLRRYREAKGAVLNSNEEHQLFIGTSLYEIDTLWGDIVISLCSNSTEVKPRRFLSINHYPWWIPMNMGHEIEFCSMLKRLQFEVVYVFTNDCPSTRWAAKFYHDLGVKVHIKKTSTLPATNYYNVIGETAIQVTIPQQLVDAIGHLFGRKQNIEKIPSSALSRLARQNGEIKIVVQKNPVFAHGLLHTIRMT